MRADFALVDQTLFAFMHEFDRIFQGQDMAIIVLVHLVDHRRQRGGFAGARGAGHEHDAVGLLAQFFKDGR